MPHSWFIPGNVPSSKNSKRVVRLKTGRTLVIGSKLTMQYAKDTEWLYKRFGAQFRKACAVSEKPYKVTFKFHRMGKHKFDYINPLQTVQDLMVKYGWIDDDNADELIPVFEKYEYNKLAPGVTITIE
tara:strand:- start:327 stop:710 length:384 start_codon:yes stop_codon:yes gene_type:complete